MLQCLVISVFIFSALEPVKLQEDDVSDTIQNINILLGSLVTKSNKQLRDLQSMREDLTFLKESVKSLNDTVAGLNDRVSGLNDSVGSLHGQIKQQTAIGTPSTNTQQMNATLNTLPSNLSHHQQETVSESAQFQISLTHLHNNLTSNLTHKLEFIVDRLSYPYTCGGTGGWRRVVYLDMTEPSSTCPSGWPQTRHTKRTCGKATNGFSCDLVTFPVSGGEYSHVCGRIKAYQQYYMDDFKAYHNGYATTIDGAYVAGVSVTHGSPRQHIWTFAAGIGEGPLTAVEACPCDASITIRIPPFVGNDYFCESGNQAGSRLINGLFADDPLWDGQNCISSSTCCSFNTPPYFVKQLPTSTTNSIEARLCQYDSGEDSPIYTANRTLCAVKICTLCVLVANENMCM